MSDWEGMWAAYDEDTYAAALSFVPPESVVLDIGAGDLRFARRLAARSRWVYAVERRPELLGGGAPDNMQVVCADARDWPFPSGLDVAVLLMRHCAHFDLYRRKLVAVGCRRLITNARWGMGVEYIDLATPPRPYEALAVGWYACRCGLTGFCAGPPEALTSTALETVVEVDDCPECHHGRNRPRLT